MRFLVAMSILLPLFMGCVNDIDNPIGSNMKEVGFTAVIEGNGVSRSNVTLQMKGILRGLKVIWWLHMFPGALTLGLINSH